MRRQCVIVGGCVGLSLFLGCAVTDTKNRPLSGGRDSASLSQPADDGQEYTSDDKIVSEAVKLEMMVRKMISVEYGDSDKRLIVHVTDESGKPMTNATMDVRLYFGHGLYGKWTDLPASDKGEISLFVPGYFGPKRIEIWVVKADGLVPRMLKNYDTHSSDAAASVPIAREDWNQMMSVFAKGCADGRNRMGRGTEYDSNRKVMTCHRKLILYKK